MRDTVERLFLLRERREENHRALWARIALCCDDVFAAAEVAKPAFDALCTKLGEDTKCPVKIAPLKDPVRVHEKATNDYKDRFGDGAPAEACLTDLLRARIEALERDAREATDAETAQIKREQEQHTTEVLQGLAAERDRHNADTVLAASGGMLDSEYSSDDAAPPPTVVRVAFARM